jgi:hypothetical protein
MSNQGEAKMNDFVDSFGYWLADFYLTTTLLLAAALVAIRCCRQPAKRLAVGKAAIVALFALAALLAYFWQTLNPTEATRFASVTKFRR